MDSGLWKMTPSLVCLKVRSLLHRAKCQHYPLKEWTVILIESPGMGFHSATHIHLRSCPPATGACKTIYKLPDGQDMAHPNTQIVSKCCSWSIIDSQVELLFQIKGGWIIIMFHFLGSMLNWITVTSKMIHTRVTKYTLAIAEETNFPLSY